MHRPDVKRFESAILKVHFSTSDEVGRALQKLGRTEDVKVSPDGRRIAIAGFNSDKILLVEIEQRGSGNRVKLFLKDVVEIFSKGLAYPHGLCFIGDSLLAVANREGCAPLIRLPACGLGSYSLDAPTVEVVLDERWLHSPGSVCSYATGPEQHELLICCNFANYVTRHTLDTGHGINVTANSLLLAGGLDLPDGVAASRDGRWIAVSNHNDQTVWLYDHAASLDTHSEPVGILRGIAYPHGLLFTADQRFIVVADAGAPFLRIYARPGRDWHGELEPVISLRVMSDELFARGNHNPMEGGVKGVDLIAGTNIVVATAEHMTLEFFDLDKLFRQLSGRRGAHSVVTFSDSQRCPCGSNKPYRKCCGSARITRPAKPTSLQAIVKAAAESLQANILARTESFCLQALELAPGHPQASHMLGYVYYQQCRDAEASRLMRAAGTATEWQSLVMRQHYSRVLGTRLLGANTTESARLRCDYARWVDGHSQNTDYRPMVSVVMVTRNAVDTIGSALASVFAQDYPNLELVIIDNDSSDGTDARIQGIIKGADIPCRFEVGEPKETAQALNEAVNLARGEYINLLDPDDLFEPTRITQLVRRIAQRGFAWGFSKCELVDDDNEMLSSVDNKYVALIEASVGVMEGADTVGSALLGLTSPSLCLGNLFFEKSLHRQVKGFRQFQSNIDRDFCLRALWQAEPCFVPVALYRHRLLRKHASGKFSDAAQAEMEQILAAYCVLAENEEPVNTFAPARATMGWRYPTGALAANQCRLPPALLIALDEALSLHEQSAASDVAEILESGVNLVGYFRGKLGLGEAARSFANACLNAGIPLNLRDAGLDLGVGQTDRSMDHLLTDSNANANTLFYINPDHLTRVWRRFSDRGELKGRRVIGCWHWEIDEFPNAWLPALDMVDEVWVNSSFVGEVVRRVTDKPVIKIPHAITVKLARSYQRGEFSLPENTFLFLFNFDFSSFVSRKNPWGAIEAFRRAFSSGEQDVGLVIKCFDGHRHPETLARLQRLADEDSRILIVDRHLSREQMYGLQSLCDAYVSLHRAEGLGLGMAECMALGKPVIGTAYSGNLEFMNRENSCLVDYSLIPVKPEDYAYYEGGWMWADPDLDDAARYMRKLVNDPEYRQRIASRAAADIAAHYSQEVMGRAISERLSVL
jgi:glycosyltransferase involved in cell wall biosynthesis